MVERFDQAIVHPGNREGLGSVVPPPDHQASAFARPTYFADGSIGEGGIETRAAGSIGEGGIETRAAGFIGEGETSGFFVFLNFLATALLGTAAAVGSIGEGGIVA